MPRPDEQIGPYTLIRQLGRGAFGVVWLAERRGAFATTRVALKLALDEEPDLDAIAQESQLWAQLGGHPNVLPIIEADRYDGQVVIVSEYAPDGSLEGWLKQHGGVAPSVEAAVSMTAGILAGLEHLHSQRIIHRDLKPANILLQGETPRLADFGLARVLKSSAQTAGIAGTPAYMSPETFSGERCAQSDLWSAGVILYQLLTGRLPFAQHDMMALIAAIGMREPELLPATIPEQLQKVIKRALEKDPAQRFASATEMRGALMGQIAVATIPVVNRTIPISPPPAGLGQGRITDRQNERVITQPEIDNPVIKRATDRDPRPPSRAPFYLGIGLVLGLGIVGGVYFFKPIEKPQIGPGALPTVSPSPAVAVEPKSSPSPSPSSTPVSSQQPESTTKKDNRGSLNAAETGKRPANRQPAFSGPFPGGGDPSDAKKPLFKPILPRPGEPLGDRLPPKRQVR